MEPRPGSNPFVLLLGSHGSGVVRASKDAAERAGLEIQAAADADGALECTESLGRPPTGILLDMTDTRAATALSLAVRSRMTDAVVPIVGLCEQVDDLGFEEAFSSGMDDCCGLAPARLARRLRHLGETVPANVERKDQVVVIADADRSSRLLMGRVFRDAGYQVHFALDAGDALRQALAESVRVVVVSAVLDSEGDDGEPLSVRGPRGGSRAAWIINTPPKQIPLVRARLGLGSDLAGTPRVPGAAKIAVHDAFASPATLLFVANELLGRPLQDARKSERLLYGTSVRFRTAGRDNEDIGYSYNVSAGGLYVRSLALPERSEELWLEFVPPRSDRLVHLEGKAVWVRRYGPAGKATVPTGFGVEITGASATDRSRFEEGYLRFLEDRTTPSVPPDVR
jgi:CheY-like chemotaxis protein